MGIDTWTPRSSPVNEQPLLDMRQATNDQNAWQNLQQQIAECTKCGLHKTRTQTVFGVGNKQTDILFIGEAPGANEDLKGEPFVGRAGQLLNAMLAGIGLKREDIFIANILKCRPPNNRDPQAEEVSCCTPYLIQQIDLIKPKLIVALGRIAAQFLLDTKTPISKLRQQMHEYQKTPLIVTFHPAYLLRSPLEKAKAWHDLQVIKQHVHRA